MNFELTGVCPQPMLGSSQEHSQVWMKNFRLEATQTHLIIAPSGTGKSTLISFLYGMRNDFTGEIKIDGQKIKSLSLRKWSRLRKDKISVVLQDLRLIPTLTTGENLLLKNRLTGFYSENQIKERLEWLGLKDKWNQKAGTLSFGQQQRVAILRSLLQPFGFILLDEPFSHLDDNNIAIATRLIQSECEARKAGMLLMSLEDNSLFPYHQKLHL